MENKLRKKMRKGEPTVGTRVQINWPMITELIGYTGMYDYVEFLAEYAPYTLYDFRHIGLAAEHVGIAAMIKLDQEPRTYFAGRALSAGILNVLFADIRTVEDAEVAVNAIRAEPKGLNGAKADRWIGYVGATGDLKDVVQMCEKKSAVDNLEAILSVDGVDMVQFGPSDYSISLGLPGEHTHPKVKEAELKTIKTALKMDVAPRAEIQTPADAQKYIELGVRDFSLNTDVNILYDWWKEKGSELQKTLETL
jgi:2-keto-3-deoxy-L-rhamnonate aldolase RhmA